MDSHAWTLVLLLLPAASCALSPGSTALWPEHAYARELVLSQTEPAPAKQAASDKELAKKTQNPVADLISVPFQNNTSFGIGPDDAVQNVTNIQPVIPTKLGDDDAAGYYYVENPAFGPDWLLRFQVQLLF